jgi:hypothetical protein
MTPTGIVTLAFLALLVGCASVDEQKGLSPTEARALLVRLIPENVRDRASWADDIHEAFAALRIPVTAENACAVIAVTAQESSFQADPVVPGLAAIARKEIDRRRQSSGIPSLAVDAALALPSTNGRSYGERLDAVRTERQLSEIYEDFIGRVPFGRTLLADRNPVRTGGPMQVSIAFGEAFSSEHRYPYPGAGSVRNEVFTRRGGMYYGIAHLLAYPASYERPLYRFADFNAGQYASRNAAFQRAVARLSGAKLELDGDLLRYDGERPAREPGQTETALRSLASRLGIGAEAIRRDLEREKEEGFEKTRLYERVYALADATGGRAPRAVLPQIPLSSPKFTRNLTSEWFANRVETRYQGCLKRAPAG